MIGTFFSCADIEIRRNALPGNQPGKRYEFEDATGRETQPEWCRS
jgi:hypothetical protein